MQRQADNRHHLIVEVSVEHEVGLHMLDHFLGSSIFE